MLFLGILSDLIIGYFWVFYHRLFLVILALVGVAGISGWFPQCLGHGYKALVDAPEARSHHEAARLEGPPLPPWCGECS
jgi:hypothetical protein